MTDRSQGESAPNNDVAERVESPGLITGEVFMVSCVSEKRRFRSEARALYRSKWFRKARIYVESTGRPWFILSAKYGLVSPSDEIDPYSISLCDQPIAYRRAWAKRVRRQLAEKQVRADKITIFAGSFYREFLEDYLSNFARTVEVPMKGLFIGDQYVWLDNKMRALDEKG